MDKANPILSLQQHTVLDTTDEYVEYPGPGNQMAA